MKTILDWSSYENAGMGDAYADIPKNGDDFAKAIAVCINSHHCETHNKGVMCPSYRISDNPLLSTGGRVRLLKQALNSDIPLTSFDSTELAEAMELCVSCKGCKRECENEVDMAMIKIEYLAQRYARQAVPLRTRLFAELPDILNSFSFIHAAIRFYNQSSFIQQLGYKLLGIAKRKLPLPHKQPFISRYQQNLPAEPINNTDGKAVTLFVDTFSQNFAPENAEAAIKVLQHSGYRVYLARDDSGTPLCCGRTQLAHGLVDKATENARRVIANLLPYAENNMPVLGLEPACLLAIRDDYRFLGLGEAAETVAKQAILFEEFIARETTAKRMQLKLKPVKGLTRPVLVHGHCHQKAVGAMKSMRKVLKLIPELKFEFIESSCCGMAGSFGMEAEHHKDSIAMAEQSLLPAIRNNLDATVIANGFSCRHQISDNTDSKPIHIARLLQAACYGQPIET